jgi:hypothetical protein
MTAAKLSRHLKTGYRRTNVSVLVMGLVSFVDLDLDSLGLLDLDTMKFHVLKSCVLESGSPSMMLTCNQSSGSVTF